MSHSQQVTVGLPPAETRSGARPIESPRWGASIPRWGASSAEISRAATREPPAPPKMAHAAIADHGLVPDFAKGSDPFVGLVAAGHSIAVAYESLPPDAMPGSAFTSAPRRTLVEAITGPIPRPHPPRAGRVPGGEKDRVTVGLPPPKRVRCTADRVPKVGRKYVKMGGSSAEIPHAATPERPAPVKMAHAAIADHGLVPDFAQRFRPLRLLQSDSPAETRSVHGRSSPFKVGREHP